MAGSDDVLIGATVQLVQREEGERHRQARILNEAGSLTICSDDSAVALELTVIWRPDLVICDTGLPGEAPLAFLRCCRALPELADIPVIVLVDPECAGTELECLELGADHVVPRRCSDSHLLAVVRACLRRYRNMRQRPGPTSAEPTGLAGALGDVSLGSLLTLLRMEAKTGTLRLVTANTAAELVVCNGRLHSVTDLERRGRAAWELIVELLRARQGSFRFAPTQLDLDGGLDMSVEQLLLLASVAMDEQASGDQSAALSIFDEHGALLEPASAA